MLYDSKQHTQYTYRCFIVPGYDNNKMNQRKENRFTYNKSGYKLSIRREINTHKVTG